MIRDISSWIFPFMMPVRAGFEKVVFIIKKENEKDFKEVIGNRMADVMDSRVRVPGLDESSGRVSRFQTEE